MPTSRGSKQKNGRSKKQHTCKHISTKLKEESELAFSVDIKEEPIDQDILPKIPAAVKDDLKDHLEKFCTSATIKKEEGQEVLRTENVLRSSVFPGFLRPTPSECQDMHNALVVLYGPRTQTPHKQPEDLLDSLVHTILSQNTTDGNSTKAFHNLKRIFPTWMDVLKADIKKLEDSIRSAGLAQTKAKRIKDILAILSKERGVPSLEYLRTMSNEDIKSELSRFNGVGPKTISCILLFNLQRPDMAVDTHVFRLAQRAGWVPTDGDVRKHNRVVQKEYKTHIPAKRAKVVNVKEEKSEVKEEDKEEDVFKIKCNRKSSTSLQLWPRVTRETVYTHLNNMIPDHLKYALHLLLITHGRRVCRSSHCLSKANKRKQATRNTSILGPDHETTRSAPSNPSTFSTYPPLSPSNTAITTSSATTATSGAGVGRFVRPVNINGENMHLSCTHEVTPFASDDINSCALHSIVQTVCGVSSPRVQPVCCLPAPLLQGVRVTVAAAVCTRAQERVFSRFACWDQQLQVVGYRDRGTGIEIHLFVSQSFVRMNHYRGWSVLSQSVSLIRIVANHSWNCSSSFRFVTEVVMVVEVSQAQNHAVLNTCATVLPYWYSEYSSGECRPGSQD
eukprot:gene9135-1433_t